MIRIPKESLPFLNAGRELELDVTRSYRKGRHYAVGVKQQMVCRAVVISSTPTGDNSWRLRIKRLSGDEARLFTRSGGYVTAPVESNPDDPDVLRGADFQEPEPLSKLQVRDLNAYREARHQLNQAALTDPTERVLADLDEMLRTTMSRRDRDRIRAARHHLRNIGKAAS